MIIDEISDCRLCSLMKTWRVVREGKEGILEKNEECSTTSTMLYDFSHASKENLYLLGSLVKGDKNGNWRRSA